MTTLVTPVSATALTEMADPTHILVGRNGDWKYGKVTYFDIAGTEAAAAEATALATPYASRAAAIATTIPAPVNRISVWHDGDLLTYQSDASGTAMTTAGGRDWSPLGDSTPGHFGAIRSDTVDQATYFLAWTADLYARSVKGYIPQGIYAVSHVRDRTITDDLVIEAHPGAIIKGLPTNDLITGTGAETSAVATFPAGALGYGVAYSSGGAETLWTENTQYTVTGTTINWGAGSAPHGALTAGHTVRIISQNPVVELGASVAYSHRIKWHGGVVDNSERGYLTAAGSGSGLSLYDFDHYDVQGVHFQGAATYADALADKVADSGFTALRCRSGVFSHNTGQGMADLMAYLTGGNLSDASDDGSAVTVQGNYARNCKQAFSVKREGGGASIIGNTAELCDIGVLVGPTDFALDGGEVIITGNHLKKCGRPIWLQKVKGAIVTSNRLIDSGYLEDGSTLATNQIAIRLEGVSGGVVSSNVVMWDTLTPPVASEGVRLGAYTTGGTIQTTNILVEGNALLGAAIGYRETDSGTGNVWGENINTCTTPVNVLSTRRWKYRKGGNTLVEGYGSTLFEAAFTPTLAFSTNGGSWSHSRQVGQYVRIGNRVTVTVSVIGVPTHTETTAHLRVIGLPFTARNVSNLTQVGALATHNGFSYPSSGTAAVVEVPANTTYLQVRATGASGAGGLVTGSQVPTGFSVRLDFTLTYEVEPYADN
jgi:hypothetical protein